MSTTTAPTPSSMSKDMKRVSFATIIGTTIEWYDFFLYANAAALVFGELFFKPAGSQAAALLSFATVGISFLFRPLGAFLAGHFGDRFGRRALLVVTLVMMGGATTLIGVLPDYQAIGIAAPILLVVLRILQGLSAGGEWGGAVLMAVEHAPANKRGRYGSFPQLGVPLGLLLSTGVLALMRGVFAPGDAFVEWGWRVPFLLSIVLIVVGFLIRRSVEESPVFKELADKESSVKAPIVKVFRYSWLLVLLAALTFAGNSAAGYMTTGGYLQKYATQPVAEGGLVGMDTTAVLVAVTGSAVVWVLTTYFGGAISDRIGRRRTYIAGWIAFLLTLPVLFPLINTGSPWLMFLAVSLFAIGNGLTYGPQAAFFVELFPASIRYSGVSITYAIGAVLGGAFAPMIAQALVNHFHTALSVVFYLASVIVAAFIATLLLRDRTGIPIDTAHEHLQEQSAIYGIR